MSMSRLRGGRVLSPGLCRLVEQGIEVEVGMDLELERTVEERRLMTQE